MPSCARDVMQITKKRFHPRNSGLNLHKYGLPAPSARPMRSAIPARALRADLLLSCALPSRGCVYNISSLVETVLRSRKICTPPLNRPGEFSRCHLSIPVAPTAWPDYSAVSILGRTLQARRGCCRPSVSRCRWTGGTFQGTNALALTAAVRLAPTSRLMAA